MIALTLVSGVVTLVSPAGNRDFLHIFNNAAPGGATVYLKYDGDGIIASVNTGMPIAPQAMLTLENVGPRNIYTKAVYAVQNSGADCEIRVAGENIAYA